MNWVKKIVCIVLGLTAALIAIGAVSAKRALVEPCTNVRPRVPSRMSLARRSIAIEE